MCADGRGSMYVAPKNEKFPMRLMLTSSLVPATEFHKSLRFPFFFCLSFIMFFSCSVAFALKDFFESIRERRGEWRGVADDLPQATGGWWRCGLGIGVGLLLRESSE